MSQNFPLILSARIWISPFLNEISCSFFPIFFSNIKKLSKSDGDAKEKLLG